MGINRKVQNFYVNNIIGLNLSVYEFNFIVLLLGLVLGRVNEYPLSNIPEIPHENPNCRRIPKYSTL